MFVPAHVRVTIYASGQLSARLVNEAFIHTSLVVRSWLMIDQYKTESPSPKAEMKLVTIHYMSVEIGWRPS